MYFFILLNNTVVNFTLKEGVNIFLNALHMRLNLTDCLRTLNLNVLTGIA